MVVARNVSTNAAQLLSLDWIVTPGISITKQTGDQPIVPPDGGVHWLVDVSRTNESHETGQACFRLDYKRLDAAGTNGPANCVTSSLDVQDRQTTPLQQLLEVRIESSLKLLQEPQTNDIYVVIKNKADFPIVVKSINARKPADIILPNLSGSRVVAPREEMAFKFQISATNRVHPGKHLLLFEVNLAWNEEGRPETGTVLSKYECDVGVLGDSEFLVPVGVPSFLLLPGFLIVIVFAMLWNVFHKDKPFPWTARSAEFWSLAIIISLLAITIYHIRGSNLLEGYGLKDVYCVWFGSAAVGLVAWVAVESGSFLYRCLEDYKKDRRTFKPEDGPVEVLRKLARNHSGFLLDCVIVKSSGATPPVFELQKAEGTPPMFWIATQIEVSFDDAPNDITKAERIVTFEGLLKNFTDAGTVASFLENKENDWVKAEWVASGTLRGVTQLPQSDRSPPVGPPKGLLVKQKI
jgi:hypothetical protein